MFVLRSGADELAKMEHSYGRRAQSTVRTLRWRDVAAIDTDDLDVAIGEATAAICDWVKQGVRTNCRWQLEGRGKCCSIIHELEIDG